MRSNSSEKHPLDSFFVPKSVAIIGATETPASVGRTILWNLMSHPFGGTIFPVNPKRENVLGIKAYPSIGQVPAAVDLAVIVTPAPTVPTIVRECIAAKVKNAIIISAGFKETGAAGLNLEKEILLNARQGNMRIIGPNCLGLMRPQSGLNATFASTIAKPGNVGFISQSGALCTAILDWSLRANVGFSAFVSIGSMLDVDWGDLIDYLGDDPYTQSIVIYMESIGDARSFLSSAREVAYKKPIIVIKAGRSEQAAQAAVSHTGALAGSDSVLDAAFARCGVLRVNTIDELFSMAEVLGKQPRPHGPKLLILTNAGGPGVLATDALIQNQGELAPLSTKSKEDLNPVLPKHWSHSNPVDILGDATPERYAQAVQILDQDQNVDGLLVILTPQAMTDPTATAQALVPLCAALKKPILTSWMGEGEIEKGKEILNRANIPTFPYPDTAAKVFSYMWQYSANLAALYETPTLRLDRNADADAEKSGQKWIESALRSNRKILTEYESKELLRAYGIPVTETLPAGNRKEAMRHAQKLGYPVVLKLLSPKVTHKTEFGGVMLNLKDSQEVERAYREIEKNAKEKAGPDAFAGVTVQPMIDRDQGYELIIGMTVDPQFGPVILFGTGGQLVEVYKDRAVALPPLNSTLARRLMEKCAIFQALKGVRGRAPVPLKRLEEILIRFSRLVLENPRIAELDVNPLFVSSKEILAMDSRVAIFPQSVADDQLPKPAIRPYPEQYRSHLKMKDKTPYTLRPIRPEDEPILALFHQTLSDQTIHLRYFNALKLSQRIAHERLARICFIDYDREMVLVAETKDKENGGQKIIAVGRICKVKDLKEAEFSILVSDPYHGKGVGTSLLKKLIAVGQAEGVKRLHATMLQENDLMLELCKKENFTIQTLPDSLLYAELKL